MTHRPPLVVRSRFALLLAGILGIAQLAAGPASAHPFHVSFAEAEWNPQTQRLEVALRTHPGDLQRALADVERNTKPKAADRPLEIEQRIERYLSSVFTFRYPGSDPQKLIWVGREVTVKETWLYFEVDLAKGLAGLEISNRLFFEIEKQQANTVNVSVGSRTKTLTFSAEHPTRPLGWPTR